MGGTRSAAPIDVDGDLIQVLRPLNGGAHTIAISGTTARNSSAFSTATRVIEIRADVACYFQTGDSSITASATDHKLPANETRVYALGGDKQTQHTHIAVLQQVGAGTFDISELE